MREESDSVKDIPEWLQKGIQENNVSYEQVLQYMASIRNAMEDDECERRIKSYSKYIGKYYKEPYSYDKYYGTVTGYYYYKILGLSRRYDSRCIFDTISFASDPEYVVEDYDVKLDGILIMDTIGVYGIDSLEEISEEEYRKALHDSMDYLLDTTLREN